MCRSARASDRKTKIQALETQGDPLWALYQEASDAAETASAVARKSGQYPLLGRGDLNIYSLFVERALDLVQPKGIVGLLVPSGIASDKTASEFFRSVSTTGRLAALLDFENKKVFFPDVHASFKFSVFVTGGQGRRFEGADCAFFLHSADELEQPERSFPLGPEDFSAVNPNTGTAPIFRSRRDAEITTAVYRRLPVLVDRSGEEEVRTWPVRYATMFHMTNDSHLFRTAEELDAEGAYRVEHNRWKKGDAVYLPLYEGKMVQMYDHRAAAIEVHPENVHRPAQPRSATAEEHANPRWLPEPQYWVLQDNVHVDDPWVLAFKDVTAPTNERTMIASLVPRAGFGNTLPLLLPAPPDSDADWEYRHYAPLLLANLNSFAFDYLARQKVQGQHLNLYILEQVPVIPPARFQESLGSRRIGDYVREQVLHLTYTAVDMEPLARDLGYEGDPFRWDEDDRRHRRARLDALFFNLYGITRTEADYILNQFPIVRDDDEAELGTFRTRDLVLAYFNAVEAGDLETRVA